MRENHMDKEWYVFMQGKGWKINNHHLKYSFEGDPYTEWDPATVNNDYRGIILERGGKTVAIFSDVTHAYHEYAFGDGVDEYIADYREYAGYGSSD